MNSTIIFDSFELAKTFKPLFVFSKDETAYPCSAEYIISHSQLYKGNDLIKNFGENTPLDMSNNIGDNLRIHKNAYKGQIESAPFYYNVKLNESFIDITFFLYYCYNPGFDILGKRYGEHDCDLEHIVVRLDSSSHKIISIYFSAHGNEGVWIMKEDIKIVNNTPIIYVAKNSHAMYNTEGIHWRVMGFANDVTDFGFAWTTKNLISINEINPLWMKYKGKWSMDGVDSIINRPFWKESPSLSSTFITRMIPVEYVYSKFSYETDFSKYKRETSLEKIIVCEQE